MKKPEFLKEWVTLVNFKYAVKFMVGLFILIGFYCMALCMWMFNKISKLYKVKK